MPELPEVEFCARRLREWVQGKRIERAWAEGGLPLRGPEKAAFVAGLIGKQITAVRRIGKQLFVDLQGADEDAVLFVHLGMTGKFLKRKSGQRSRLATRLKLWFADGMRLDYIDPRRFGHLYLVPAETAADHPVMARLGPDAMALCRTPDGLATAMGGTRRAVKVALMDQKRLAGVGNIYAAEALFLAGVNPWTPASILTAAQWDAVAQGIIESMTESLAREKDDEIRYLQDREAENPFIVYGREGVDCTRCGTPIERAMQAQRATFWCPSCQPSST
jgi:formamidopyrimidine-DNA glycosylase